MSTDLSKQIDESRYWQLSFAQVGEMIARAARGEYTCDVTADIGETSDNAILVASALLAVAAEIRGVDDLHKQKDQQ